MKKLVVIALSTLLISGISSSYAQQKKDTTTTMGQDIKQAGKSTGKAANKVGNKVGEIGAKGAAAVKDKRLKNIKGPHGETVYVDKYNRKYYINKNAKRVYIK